MICQSGKLNEGNYVKEAATHSAKRQQSNSLKENKYQLIEIIDFFLTKVKL